MFCTMKNFRNSSRLFSSTTPLSFIAQAEFPSLSYLVLKSKGAGRESMKGFIEIYALKSLAWLWEICLISFSLVQLTCFVQKAYSQEVYLAFFSQKNRAET